jgi:hypothetical protein
MTRTGAGQDLITHAAARDASGNIRLADVGAWLRDQITSDFAAAEMDPPATYDVCARSHRPAATSRLGTVQPSIVR